MLLLEKMKSLGTQEAILVVISFPTLVWIRVLKMSYSTFLEMQDLLSKLQTDQGVPKGYSLQQGLILKRWRFVIDPKAPFK